MACFLENDQKGGIVAKLRTMHWLIMGVVGSNPTRFTIEIVSVMDAMGISLIKVNCNRKNTQILFTGFCYAAALC